MLSKYCFLCCGKRVRRTFATSLATGLWTLSSSKVCVVNMLTTVKRLRQTVSGSVVPRDIQRCQRYACRWHTFACSVRLVANLPVLSYTVWSISFLFAYTQQSQRRILRIFKKLLVKRNALGNMDDYSITRISNTRYVIPRNDSRNWFVTIATRL